MSERVQNYVYAHIETEAKPISAGDPIDILIIIGLPGLPTRTTYQVYLIGFIDAVREIAQVMCRPRPISNQVPTRIVVTEIKLARLSGQTYSERGKTSYRHILPSQEEESSGSYKVLS